LLVVQPTSSLTVVFLTLQGSQQSNPTVTEEE